MDKQTLADLQLQLLQANRALAKLTAAAKNGELTDEQAELVDRAHGKVNTAIDIIEFHG